jgi:hypothetical protein
MGRVPENDLSFGVYLRDNQVLVVPSAWGVDLDHVLLVEPVESKVQQAIEAAIEVLSPVPARPDYDPKKWPVLKALGLKSARAFYQNVAHVLVLIHEGRIEVLPSDPTKRGQAFEGIREPIPVAEIDALGTVVLKALRESPRMNPIPARGR